MKKYYFTRKTINGTSKSYFNNLADAKKVYDYYLLSCIWQELSPIYTMEVN